MTTRNCMRALIALLTLVAAGSANAILVRLDFSGQIDFVDAALAGGPFTVGDMMSGSVTYDTMLSSDGDPSDPNFGVYDAVVAANITAGSYMWTAPSGAGNVQVNDDFFVGPGVDDIADIIVFNVNDPFPGTGDPVNSKSLVGFALTLGEFIPGGTIISDDLLPMTIEPSDWETFNVELGFIDPSTTALLSVRDFDTVVTVSTVPVPAAAWLFGSALGLLGWVRRKIG